jgi:hypothetical protein
MTDHGGACQKEKALSALRQRLFLLTTAALRAIKRLVPGSTNGLPFVLPLPPSL